jgi:hypothetical protein
VGLSVVARFIRVPVATQSRRRQQQQQQQHQRVLQLQACLKSQLCNCWSPRHTRPQSRHFPCYAFQGKSADPVIVWMETDASCQVGAACRGGGPAPAASSLECEGRGAERVEEWSFSRSTMCYYFGIMLEWTQTSRFFCPVTRRKANNDVYWMATMGNLKFCPWAERTMAATRIVLTSSFVRGWKEPWQRLV